jgi:hypothetical protein
MRANRLGQDAKYSQAYQETARSWLAKSGSWACLARLHFPRFEMRRLCNPHVLQSPVRKSVEYQTLIIAWQEMKQRWALWLGETDYISAICPNKHITTSWIAHISTGLFIRSFGELDCPGPHVRLTTAQKPKLRLGGNRDPATASSPGAAIALTLPKLPTMPLQGFLSWEYSRLHGPCFCQHMSHTHELRCKQANNPVETTI